MKIENYNDVREGTAEVIATIGDVKLFKFTFTIFAGELGLSTQSGADVGEIATIFRVVDSFDAEEYTAFDDACDRFVHKVYAGTFQTVRDTLQMVESNLRDEAGLKVFASFERLVLSELSQTGKRLTNIVWSPDMVIEKKRN